MAQSAELGLLLAAHRSYAQPIWQVLCDWDDVGFARQSSWYDETAYLLGASGEMSCGSWQQSLSPLGPSAVGNARVLMDNQTNRFSVADPTSALYSKIGGTKIKFKRIVVKLGYHLDIDYLCPQITGYITEVIETENAEKVEFKLMDRGAEMATLSVYSQIAQGWPHDYIDLLTPLLVRDKLAQDGGWGTAYIDPGIYPLSWAWADGETLWDELNLLAVSQMGIIFWDKAGNFHFKDGGHWVRINTVENLSAYISQAQFDKADFEACIPTYDIRRQFSKIIVEYTPRYAAPLQSVYSNSDVWLLPPLATQTFDAKFRNPVAQIIAPVVNEDYTVITPGGIDISSDVDVTFSYYATKATITVTNHHATLPAVIGGLEFHGYPILARQAARYEAVEPGAWAENAWKVTNPYIQSYNQARMLGDFALARYSGQMHGIRLVGVKSAPWLEVGDRITVTADGLDPLHDDYFIVKQTWSTGYPMLMDMECIRADDLYPLTDYFCVGGGTYHANSYGQVSGHGHLFW